MAMGVEMLRAAGRRVRGAMGRRITVREVCLIGVDHRACGESWTAGQTVNWLGRGYQVVATPADIVEPSGDADAGPVPARRYIHLASYPKV
jgi:hypothetical protein